MTQTTIDFVEEEFPELAQRTVEDSDVCVNHISLGRRELRRLSKEQNPLVECAICDGYNYNCSQYHSKESP